jgi:hypothetical protein
MQENDKHNGITIAAGIPTDNQSVISAAHIDAKGMKQLHMKAAMALYMTASSFTLFHDPAMKTLFQSLNPAFKMPDRRQFAGGLLDEAYNSVKVEVDCILQASNELNIITDESTNITMHRIANISVHTQNGAFHYASEDVGHKRMTAVAIQDWLMNHLNVLTGNDLQRINSIATDTCATMGAVWRLLENNENMRHTLFVPCDAHGLQLLVKDLLQHVPFFKTTHQQAQSIATAFRSAPLQYSRLRAQQKRKYNQHFALILAVITRWGSQ